MAEEYIDHTLSNLLTNQMRKSNERKLNTQRERGREQQCRQLFSLFLIIVTFVLRCTIHGDHHQPPQ